VGPDSGARLDALSTIAVRSTRSVRVTFSRVETLDCGAELRDATCEPSHRAGPQRRHSRVSTDHTASNRTRHARRQRGTRRDADGRRDKRREANLQIESLIYIRNRYAPPRGQGGRPVKRTTATLERLQTDWRSRSCEVHSPVISPRGDLQAVIATACPHRHLHGSWPPRLRAGRMLLRTATPCDHLMCG
jgi:hypothetical protein